MANRRYLEFDSTYRNRDCYPCPANFVTELTCSQLEITGETANDPYFENYPTESFYQIPYTGSDNRVMFGTPLSDHFGTEEPTAQLVLNIPRKINGKTYTALSPINWMNGVDGGIKTGVRGSRIKYTTTPIWEDIFIRNQNNLDPQQFSGGNSSQPMLSQLVSNMTKTNEYLSGAMLFRFKSNPIVDPVDPGGNEVGSLGWPYYYQTVSIKEIPGTPVNIGDLVEKDSGDPMGYVACIISPTEYVVRLGGSNPRVDQEYPPYCMTIVPFYFDTTVDITVTINSQGPYDVTSATQSDITVGYYNLAAYYYCGFVESSKILIYYAESGICRLETPFLDGGSNGYDVATDYFLIDFNTDPTGYYKGVEFGKSRIFFAGGKRLANYFTDIVLQNTNLDEKLECPTSDDQAKVVGYDDGKRILFLEKGGIKPQPPVYLDSTSVDFGEPGVSVYTIIFLDEGLEYDVPTGTLIRFSGKDLNFYTALPSKKGSKTLTFGSEMDPAVNSESLISIASDVSVVDYVCPPVWINNDNYNDWKAWVSGGGFLQLDADPVGFSGKNGAISGISRGKSYFPVNQCNPTSLQYVSVPTPENMSFTLNENGVSNISIVNPGLSYQRTVINGKHTPLLAVMKLPTSLDAELTGMLPRPEKYKGKTTGFNLCYVDILNVSRKGEILEVSINTPGYNYLAGATLNLLNVYYDEAQGRLVKGPGHGGQIKVESTCQFIGVFGNQIANIPKVGAGVYLSSFGWGLDESTRNIYNSAPDVARFILEFDSDVNSSQEFKAIPTGFPAKIQNCVKDDKTMPETGFRLINYVINNNNNAKVFKFYEGGGGGDDDIFTPIDFYSGEYETGSGGENKPLFIGLNKGFSLSSFAGMFSLAQDEYINEDYIINNPIEAGQFIDCDKSLYKSPNLLPFTNLATGNSLELLCFTSESAFPLNYTGSTVSQNQMVCYEMELISLILPNQPLRTPFGGLIAFYPFVYLEVTNVTAPSSGNAGVIYSNNPNAQRAVFKAAITDTPTPLISSFIKVSGHKQVQTVKFKPNDNLRFRVFFGDGQLFETVLKDNAPPAPPDPFVQISAELSIRRII